MQNNQTKKINWIGGNVSFDKLELLTEKYDLHNNPEMLNEDILQIEYITAKNERIILDVGLYEHLDQPCFKVHIIRNQDWDFPFCTFITLSASDLFFTIDKLSQIMPDLVAQLSNG
jgi:hypothetical protein